MSSEQHGQGDTSHILQELERQLLTPEVRASREAVADLIADEFVEFGSSGRIYTKAEILAELASEPRRTFTLSDFILRAATPDSALVTYRVTRANRGGSRRESLRSSFWVRRDGRWQMLFHQGTRSGETLQQTKKREEGREQSPPSFL